MVPKRQLGEFSGLTPAERYTTRLRQQGAKSLRQNGKDPCWRVGLVSFRASQVRVTVFNPHKDLGRCLPIIPPTCTTPRNVDIYEKPRVPIISTTCANPIAVKISTQEAIFRFSALCAHLVLFATYEWEEMRTVASLWRKRSNSRARCKTNFAGVRCDARSSRGDLLTARRGLVFRRRPRRESGTRTFPNRPSRPPRPPPSAGIARPRPRPAGWFPSVTAAASLAGT